MHLRFYDDANFAPIETLSDQLGYSILSSRNQIQKLAEDFYKQESCLPWLENLKSLF